MSWNLTSHILSRQFYIYSSFLRVNLTTFPGSSRVIDVRLLGMCIRYAIYVPFIPTRAVELQKAKVFDLQA